MSNLGAGIGSNTKLDIFSAGWPKEVESGILNYDKSVGESGATCHQGKLSQ